MSFLPTFMLLCYVYFLHLCCHAMFIILHLCCHAMFMLAFMLSCYVYFLHLCCYAMFIILHLCCYAMFIFLHLCCYAIFIFWIYVVMLCFFCFIVACTPMPACPANYERLGIPAGVAGAGTILQSCYRVIPGALTYAAGAVSICTCCKLCWRISKYMYLM
jgi:hypothetical protein